MADSDPPDEVDDGKSPPNRNVDAPDPDALGKEVGHRKKQNLQNHERDEKSRYPAQRDRPFEDDRADVVGDTGKGMSGLNDWSLLGVLYQLGMLCHALLLLRLSFQLGVR